MRSFLSYSQNLQVGDKSSNILCNLLNDKSEVIVSSIHAVVAATQRHTNSRIENNVENVMQNYGIDISLRCNNKIIWQQKNL